MDDISRKELYPGWTVVRKLGTGSFGAVYEIERDLFGKKEKAALKLISIPQSEDDVDELVSGGYDEQSITAHYRDYLADIVREYSLMVEMKGHTNVVYCDDIRYIQHDDGYGWDIYIKMELLTPLLKATAEQLGPQSAAKLGRDLCGALVLCESRGIIHRDIKPQNIFVSRDGDYKLGDFGIAKTIEKTSGGTKVGTYNYMAPEVYNNRPYGHTSDVYSLGLVMYWMLNEKRLPFLPLPPALPRNSETEEARMRRFRGETLPPPAHGSEELKRIVLKACAFEAKDRYQSAAEMLADIEAISVPAAGRGAGRAEPREKSAPELPIEQNDDATVSGVSSHRTAPETAVRETPAPAAETPTERPARQFPPEAPQPPRTGKNYPAPQPEKTEPAGRTEKAAPAPGNEDEDATVSGAAVRAGRSDPAQSAAPAKEPQRAQTNTQPDANYPLQYPQRPGDARPADKATAAQSAPADRSAQKKKKLPKWAVIALAVLGVLVIAALALLVLRPVAGSGGSQFSRDGTIASLSKGGKHIYVTVIHGDGSQKEIQIDTDAGTLRAALEEKGIISGTEGQWGLFVDTVDGETADYSANGAWWRFSKSGEDLIDSVDNTAISDGDRYEITYSVEGAYAATSSEPEAEEEEGWGWLLDGTTLTISGRGRIDDFYHASYTPWSEYRDAIESVVILDGITQIGRNTFRDCKNLENVYLPESLTVIGANAFSGCSKLKSIEIPAGVTAIRDEAFSGCTALDTVVIEDGLISIGINAFSGCENLTTICLPASVETIKYSAFSGCTRLKYVYFAGSSEDWSAIQIGNNNGCLTSAEFSYDLT